MHWGVPLIVAFFIGIVSAMGVAFHKDIVADSLADAQRASAQNAYVRMVAGDTDLTDATMYPGVAHLYRYLKPQITGESPASALLSVHVPVGEFDNVNHIIDFNVAYIDQGDESGDLNPRTGKIGDGELTSEFILLNLQALDSPDDAMQAVRPVKDDGKFTWRNAALVTAAPIVLYTVLIMPVFFIGEWVKNVLARRKHKKWLTGLSSEAREIYRIRARLAANKPKTHVDKWGTMRDDKLRLWLSTPEGKAYTKAEQAFLLATDGWTNAEHDAELARLTNELNDLVQAIRTGQQTYRDM